MRTKTDQCLKYAVYCKRKKDFNFKTVYLFQGSLEAIWACSLVAAY